jgi:uncharacterized protein
MSKWWSEGIRFECQGSGQCCVSRGQYGFVYLSLADRRQMAKFLKLQTRDFTKNYCEKDRYGKFHLKEDQNRLECMFLKDNRCGVYSARPTQCRTWPFWPEVMGAKTWAKEVAAYCPGVGKGPVISPEQIQKQLDQQSRSEEE